MEVYCLVNKPVPSNTYVLFDKNINNSCVIIDPGTKECTELFKLLSKYDLSPSYILLTHEHFDHIWGVNTIKERYNSKVICSKKCAEKIGIPQNYYNLLYFGSKEDYSINMVDAFVEDLHCGLVINTLKFNFVFTPGHSSSSICISINNILFTGDTIMKGYKPLILKRHEGSKSEYKESVLKVFNDFQPDTIIYPGHGDKFLLKEVEQYYKDYFGI